MKIFSKKIVLLAVLAAVAVAACYLNGKIGSRYASVNENDNPLNAELVSSYAEEDIINGTKKVSSDFFDEYRLEREKTRSENIETLQSITASAAEDESDSSEKAKAEIVDLVKLSEQELLLENLIKSKGFKDCLVFIHNGYVNVLVDSAELTQAQAVQIRDAIASECDVALSDITIATSAGQ